MHSPTPALETDDLRVMQKSVESGDRGGGLTQHLAPVLDGSVRRNQNGTGLIAAGEDLQQVLGRGGWQTRHAEILDHPQVDPRRPRPGPGPDQTPSGSTRCSQPGWRPPSNSAQCGSCPYTGGPSSKSPPCS